jgi:type IV pilus assembly protein PilC
MLTYKYVARNASTGEKIKAVVQAESEMAAAKLIRQQGLAPIEIVIQQGGGAGLGKRFNKVKTKDRILFSRQLSTLINAGLPLIQSLRTVVAQTKSKPLQIVVNQIITDIEAGSSFADALGRHPTVFSRVYVSLIAAGEASGTMDHALERLAFQQEKDAEIIAKVRGAMVYPAIVLLVMGAVIVFMIVSVLPQVKELYKGIGGGAGQLPFVTRFLLALSDFVIKDWYFVVIGIGALAFFTSRWVQTLGGKSALDRIKMSMPPINQLFMKLYMARFARTSTTLVGSGVPLIQTLMITSEAVDNVHISHSLDKAIEKVKGGRALSECLEGDPNFLDLVPNMLRIGEQSGAIEDMLAKTADYFEKEVDTQIKTISTIIEPVLMIIMGIVALTIVTAILLPIYGLVGKTIIK